MSASAGIKRRDSDKAVNTVLGFQQTVGIMTSDENGGRLNFSPDNDKLVKISQEYKNGINYITLKALAPGKVNIEARTLEGGVTKTFVVNIIQPIKNNTLDKLSFLQKHLTASCTCNK